MILSRNLMYRTIRRPTTNPFAVEVQRDRTNEKASKVQSRDSQHRTNVPILNDPIVEELRHAVAKHVLEHRGAD
jgi:hypothetical protein